MHSEVITLWYILNPPFPVALFAIAPCTAVAIRLYSGWNYVSLRLGAEVVEYEESGRCRLSWSTRSQVGAACLLALANGARREGILYTRL